MYSHVEYWMATKMSKPEWHVLPGPLHRWGHLSLCRSRFTCDNLPREDLPWSHQTGHRHSPFIPVACSISFTAPLPSWTHFGLLIVLVFRAQGLGFFGSLQDPWHLDPQHLKLRLAYLLNWFEAYIHIRACLQTFISGLFIIAPNLKQPRCPPTARWTNKLWYIYTMGYYSVIKRAELPSHKKT